jgi:hypothetical protein
LDNDEDDEDDKDDGSNDDGDNGEKLDFAFAVASMSMYSASVAGVSETKLREVVVVVVVVEEVLVVAEVEQL